MAEIYKDNEGVVLKKLGKPVRRTVVDKNTRVSDDDSMDMPSEPVNAARPSSIERPRKRTLLANAGPDEEGKIDFSVNPDCVDYLLQYHESYGNSSDADGIADTCSKVISGFNKTFKSRMTPEELSPALESRLVLISSDVSTDEMRNRKPGQRLRKTETAEVVTRVEERVGQVSQVAPEPDVPYMSLHAKSLSVVEGQKVLLSGEKFEICKILHCKNICAVTRSKGKINQNGLMHAACSVSEKGQINKNHCPQETPLSEKEALAYQMFLQQFGDELRAKKMLFISREVFSK